jgi:hypothetical protein
LYFFRSSTTPAKLDRALSAVFRKFIKIILAAFLGGGIALSCFDKGYPKEFLFF